MTFSQPQSLDLKSRSGNTMHIPQFGSQGVDGTQMDIYDGKIYVKTSNNYQQDIEVYTPDEDKWDLHCKGPYDLISFAMAMMNGQLVPSKITVKFIMCSYVLVYQVTCQCMEKWHNCYEKYPSAKFSCNSSRPSGGPHIRICKLLRRWKC